MSDPVLVAVIGVVGTIVGAAATVLVARIQAAQKAAQQTPPEKPETTVVLGQAVDIRELRILRALFGEPKGRLLEAYQVRFYEPFLKSVIKKGWVKRIEKRYYMTPRGADFCRAYLKELFDTWQPASQVLG
jgi:hypothetical protein